MIGRKMTKKKALKESKKWYAWLRISFPLRTTGGKYGTYESWLKYGPYRTSCRYYKHQQGDYIK